MNNDNQLIDRYLKRGFGSMTKNDFEVAIFNELLLTQLIGKSNYEISLFLKISETKVKRLRYESELKYGKHDEKSLKERMEELLTNTHFQADGRKIQFIIENQFIRSYLDNKLKGKGLFSDRSFNSEIVNIDAKSFITILKEMQLDDNIITDVRNTSLIEAIKGAAKAIGKVALEFSLSSLKPIL